MRPLKIFFHENPNRHNVVIINRLSLFFKCSNVRGCVDLQFGLHFATFWFTGSIEVENVEV